MHVSVLAFVGAHIRPDEIRGKRVVEVGAREVNGAVGPVLRNLGEPAEYVGTDLEPGPGVEVVCRAEALADRFGEAAFDLVVCVETLEHVRDWQAAVHHMKAVCRAGGVLVLSARSQPFKYHGFPHDYWRFSRADMAHIFGDCADLELYDDPQDPGVFVKARKPAAVAERDLSDYAVYSIVTGARETAFVEAHRDSPQFRRILARRRRRARRKRLRAWRARVRAALLGGR